MRKISLFFRAMWFLPLLVYASPFVVITAVWNATELLAERIGDWDKAYRVMGVVLLGISPLLLLMCVTAVAIHYSQWEEIHDNQN